MIPRKVNLPTPKDDVERDLFSSIKNAFIDYDTLVNGNITFSDNMDVVFVTYASNASANTEDTLSHSLGKVPTGYIVYSKNKAGTIYDGSTTWTSSNIYLKCDTSSVTFKLIVF